MENGHRFQKFESLVNTEGIQTTSMTMCQITWFESLVNTEGIQTKI